MLYLRESTSASLKMGPFVSSADGYTAQTSLTIAQADVRLSKEAVKKVNRKGLEEKKIKKGVEITPLFLFRGSIFAHCTKL